MGEIESHYRTDNGAILIEMRLRTVMQIFNSLDPSPFHEKDLDPDAEAYITEIVQDFPLAQPMKIVIHLPCKEAECDEAKTLEIGHPEPFQLSRGLGSEGAPAQVPAGEGEPRHRPRLPRHHGVHILRSSSLTSSRPRSPSSPRGFSSSVWVAMWEPINTFLYLWWPIRRKQADLREDLPDERWRCGTMTTRAMETRPGWYPREES